MKKNCQIINENVFEINRETVQETDEAEQFNELRM